MLNMMSCSLNSWICFSATESCTTPITLGLLSVFVLSHDASLPVYQYRDLMLISAGKQKKPPKNKPKLQPIRSEVVNLPPRPCRFSCIQVSVVDSSTSSASHICSKQHCAFRLGLIKMWKLKLILWLKALSMQFCVHLAVVKCHYFLSSPEEKKEGLQIHAVKRGTRVHFPTKTVVDEDGSFCLQALISSTITYGSEGWADDITYCSRGLWTPTGSTLLNARSPSGNMSVRACVCVYVCLSHFCCPARTVKGGALRGYGYRQTDLFPRRHPIPYHPVT